MKMKKSKSRGSAYNSAINLLSYRPRAKGELAAALLGKEYLPEEIDTALADLERLGYLNDIAFMESWCYYRQHVAPKGRWLVQSELASKGICQQDLAAHFDQFYSAKAEKACLQQLLEKQLHRHGQNREMDDPAARQKLAQKYFRKGFDLSLIFEVLDRLEE